MKLRSAMEEEEEEDEEGKGRGTRRQARREK